VPDFAARENAKEMRTACRQGRTIQHDAVGGWLISSSPNALGEKAQARCQ